MAAAVLDLVIGLGVVDDVLDALVVEGADVEPVEPVVGHGRVQGDQP